LTLSFRPDKSVFWQRHLDTGEVISIHAQEIRRDRTGMHADISIWLQKAILGSDDLNLKKNEERVRLSNSVFKAFGDVVKAAYPLEYLKHDIDAFCRELPEFWEESQYEIVRYSPGGEVAPIAFVLAPYLIEEAITIVFGPQGTGKSYLAKLIGLNVCGSSNGFWHVPVLRPVMYVNLERPGKSMERRAQMLMNAFRIKSCPEMDYIHAQGANLQSLAQKLRVWIREHPGGLFILDSISFTGMGSLNDDTTAAAAIRLLRAIGGTWLVLGHTPRADTTHLIGSTLHDAGADIMINLAGERRGSITGLAMSITKANDIGIPAPYYLAFEFSPPDPQTYQSMLLKVRKADAEEFPELQSGEKKSRFEQLKDYVEAEGQTTAYKAAVALKFPRPNIVDMLKHDDFERLPMVGPRGQVYFRLRVPF